jgi:hypothetical protein
VLIIIIGHTRREDEEEKIGLTGHPKADDLYEKAWAKSHSSGLRDVMNEMDDLAVLIR